MSQQEVRAALKACPDGATVAELGRIANKKPCNVRLTLKLLRGAYIYRWALAKSGPHKYAAVFALHEGPGTPDDAPKPD